MRLILYSIFCFGFMIGVCFGGSSAKESNTGSGVGVITCYEFLHPGNSGYENRDIVFLSWAQGFMTAKNVYGDYKVDLFTMGIKEQIVAVKVFCEEHKRKLFVHAVESLYQELYEKGKQEK
jgi:hypothetical protein